MAFKKSAAQNASFTNRMDGFTDRGKEAFSPGSSMPDSVMKKYSLVPDFTPDYSGQRTNRHTENSPNVADQFRSHSVRVDDSRGYEINSSDAVKINRAAAARNISDGGRGLQDGRQASYMEPSVTADNASSFRTEDGGSLFRPENGDARFRDSHSFTDRTERSFGQEQERYFRNEPDARDAAARAGLQTRQVQEEVLGKYSSTDKFKDPTAEQFIRSTYDSHTERGYGGDFHSFVNDKGKIQTQLTLAKGKDRSDRKGFKGKSAVFVDRAGRVFESVSPEKEDSAASVADDKAIVTTKALQGHFRDERERYKDIRVGKQEEVKQLEQLVKAENKENARRGGKKSPFSESKAVFKDDSNSFTDKMFSRFRLPGENSRGESYFVPTEEQRMMAVAASLEAKGFSGTDSSAFDRKAAANNGKGMSQGRSAQGTGVDTGRAFSSDGEALDKKGLGEKASKFEAVNSSNGGKDGGKGNRSVQSYFADAPKDGRESGKGSVNPHMSNSEKLEYTKSEKKEAAKKEKKAKRKQAATASVQRLLRVKKGLQNDLGNVSGEVSGDLMKEGTPRALRALIDIKEALMEKIRMILIQVGSSLAPILALICGIIVVYMLFYSVFTSVFALLSNQDLSVPTGDGYTYAYLSEDEIDGIIENLYDLYGDEMTYDREVLMRYCLSKVGCAYDQAEHWNMVDDIFDCSSLAYRTYQQIGIDISNNGYFSAAEEARYADNNGYNAYGELLPGDLVFYGGSDNGRYNGVYHVGIYVGDGKMVEARGKSWGVVYTDVRSSNVVSYGRYL